MIENNELLASKVSVRLYDVDTQLTVGSGTLYYDDHLRNVVYVLTAAHCLFRDLDQWQDSYDNIGLSLYNSFNNNYVDIVHEIDFALVNRDADKDVAILVLDKKMVELLIGDVPKIKTIRNRHSSLEFILKGFPSATQGKELDGVKLSWLTELTASSQFQLRLNQEYARGASTGPMIKGYSGGGVFLVKENKYFLYGIFVRFREVGKVMYCQYIDFCNNLLRSVFRQEIKFIFLGEYGLDIDFFQKHIQKNINDLGPRYNNEFNFDLPIARMFNSIARDDFFKKRLLLLLDNFLSVRSYISCDANSLIGSEEVQYHELREFVLSWIADIRWAPSEIIDANPLVDKFKEVSRSLDVKVYDLINLRLTSSELPNSDNSNNSGEGSYERMTARLREMLKSIRVVLNNIGNIQIPLSNKPCLLLKGEAGSGKSHLLGDVARKRTIAGKPTLLLLGQHFVSSRNIIENIVSQLGLAISKNELLTSLNNIGQDLGERVLVFIDAINEGPGKKLWVNELAGFISDISAYPYIGLVLSVRSNYWEVVVPQLVRDDESIAKVTHNGFTGNEYAALKIFCAYNGLQQPSFPMLAPEYANPLFLQLMCKGAKEAGYKSLPQNFQGMDIVLGYYIRAIYNKIKDKRENYRFHKKIVSQAVEEYVKYSIDSGETMLQIGEVYRVFMARFSDCPSLLADLIDENLFIENIYTDIEGNQTDCLYFSYERIGDYFTAKVMLDSYKSAEAVIEACGEMGVIGSKIEELCNYKRGILEALAILIPEQYSIEITEAFGWLFEKDSITHYSQKKELNIVLFDSFKWRRVASINNDTITDWINSKNCRLTLDEIIFKMCELTTIHNHPFNSDRLHEIFMKISLPNRDAFWQKHLRYNTNKEDDANVDPLIRLMEWAWQDGISLTVDSETARLAGQTLTWLLASTNRVLRDKVTKALVNLLQDQPGSLICILKVFANVNDPYIYERIIAVVYGCALRTSSQDGLKNIAQFIYDLIFKNGNVVNHVLIRDYARNTIEYALYKNVGIEVDIKRVRPPYNSQMPVFPSKAKVKKYYVDYGTQEFEKKGGFPYNMVYRSVMDGDFGTYVIDRALRDFYPIRSTANRDIAEVIRALPRGKRQIVKSFVSLYKKINCSRSNLRLSDVDKQTINEMSGKVSAILGEEYFKSFMNQLLPDALRKKGQLQREYLYFDSSPVKRWIVNRVFDLGYDTNLHAEYDTSIKNNRHENSLERIGKKYQWIALYEIMAVIADNYWYQDDFINSSKLSVYQGPWQNGLRNIDPSFISIREENDELLDEESLIVDIANSDWWLDSSYDYWNQDTPTWIQNRDDIPNPLDIILRKDTQGVEWMYLALSVRWQEPKPIGADRYDSVRKDIWYLVNSYLVKKRDKNKFVAWLNEQDFWGRWLPETDTSNDIINRELYWSPAAINTTAQNSEWQAFDGSKFQGIVSTTKAVGEMHEDQSGAHFEYLIPCKTLFEGMGLQYDWRDGNLIDQNGCTVVTNINPHGVMIRKKQLLEFLERNDMDIIWSLLGEKRVTGSAKEGSDHRHSVLNGVYSFVDGVLAGKLDLLVK